MRPTCFLTGAGVAPMDNAVASAMPRGKAELADRHLARHRGSPLAIPHAAILLCDLGAFLFGIRLTPDGAGFERLDDIFAIPRREAELADRHLARHRGSPLAVPRAAIHL